MSEARRPASDAQHPQTSSEAQRQQALIEALRSRAPRPAHDALRFSGAADRIERGLRAYRDNAAASAVRALAAAFPTVRAMLGAAEFARLAEAFLAAHPPICGDLGEWGAAFPAHLAAHLATHAGTYGGADGAITTSTDLAARATWARWPWLADSARLDWAVQVNERAADAVLDADSLMRLQDHDPASLRLRLMPGSALIESAWPIVLAHTTHRLPAEQAESALEPLHAAISERRGETAFVVRQGWRASVQALSAAETRWMRSLLDGASLADALAVAGDDFDFSAWLATAVRLEWLEAVVVSRAA